VAAVEMKERHAVAALSGDSPAGGGAVCEDFISSYTLAVAVGREFEFCCFGFYSFTSAAVVSLDIPSSPLRPL
jgi:hypothetical protein